MWDEAAIACIEGGGQLAYIESEREWNQLAGAMKASGCLACHLSCSLARCHGRPSVPPASQLCIERRRWLAGPLACHQPGRPRQLLPLLLLRHPHQPALLVGACGHVGEQHQSQQLALAGSISYKLHFPAALGGRAAQLLWAADQRKELCRVVGVWQPQPAPTAGRPALQLHHALHLQARGWGQCVRWAGPTGRQARLGKPWPTCGCGMATGAPPSAQHPCSMPTTGSLAASKAAPRLPLP